MLVTTFRDGNDGGFFYSDFDSSGKLGTWKRAQDDAASNLPVGDIGRASNRPR